jgi:hypothetical protein
MRLSPNWRFLILEGLDELFKPIECEFVNKYFEHLQFKRSYTNSSLIFSGGRAGLRLDRVLVCEVLHNQRHLNKCLRLSYAYKHEKQVPKRTRAQRLKPTPKPQMPEHCADFQLDIVPRGHKRLTWLHKDDTETKHLKDLYE